MTEHYVIVKDNIKKDTLEDTTYNYKLRIEKSPKDSFDICFDAIDAFHFSSPIHATITDDSTFFFSQQIPAVPSYGYINGKCTVSYIQLQKTIKMDYIKSGPNQYGEEHHYSVTGIEYK